jgi:hypothetical protein
VHEAPGYGGSAPHREDVKARSSVPGARAVTLRYGPYTVPNTKVNNSLGEFGMMADVPRNDLQKYVPRSSSGLIDI